jgi:hypothetical protein
MSAKPAFSRARKPNLDGFILSGQELCGILVQVVLMMVYTLKTS